MKFARNSIVSLFFVVVVVVVATCALMVHNTPERGEARDAELIARVSVRRVGSCWLGCAATTAANNNNNLPLN